MSSSAGKMALLIGSLINLAISGLHIYFVFAGAEIYRYFGAGEKLTSMLESGSPLPAISVIVLAGVFTMFALYGLALAGFLKTLPLQKQVVLAIAIIYILRSLLLLKIIIAPASCEPQMTWFALVALLVGLLYLYGWLKLRNSAICRTQPAECH